MNGTRKTKKKQHSTANFHISYFIMSGRSKKKIYNLQSYHVAILRYLCDCMDINYNRTKKLEIKIYQNQIAINSFITRQLVNRSIQYLIKKRLLIKVKKNVYSIGKVLIMCNAPLQSIDVSRSVTEHRYVTEHYTSKASNSIKHAKELLNPKQKEKAWNGMAPTSQSVSPLLDEYLNKKERH